MSAASGLAIKLGLSLLAAVVIWRAGRPRRREAGRRKLDRALVGLALVSLVAFVNFGSFNRSTVLHYGELFHYVLGAKYFPELGYDGLYAASLEAEAESMPGHPLPPETRDLRTRQIVPTSTLAGVRAEVKARFSPRRWRSFVADHHVFLPQQGSQFLAIVRLDHGFNPPPSWAFIGRQLTRFLPITRTTLGLLALIDPLLLVAAFALVYRAYGLRTTAVAVTLFGLGFAWQYVWVSGAFLRYDWFAATLAALCLAHRGRASAAGVALAYAAAIRVFPALLLAPLAFVAVRHLRRREAPAHLLRFAAGFAGGLLVMLALGSLAGRGVSAWTEFARNIEAHRETWSPNNTGLQMAFAMTGDTLTTQIPAAWPVGRRFEVWQERMEASARNSKAAFAVVAALLLALAGAAAWDTPLDEALVVGIAVVFAALVLTCYYWVLLVAGALRVGRLWAPALLLLNALLCGMELAGTPSEVTFAAMAWGLLALLVAWLAPAGWRTVRARFA